MLIEIPSFVTLTHQPGPIVPVARLAQSPSTPAMPGLSIWGKATLKVRDWGDGTFAYQLRSRLNSPILRGGPIQHCADVMAAAHALLALCSQERSLRIDETSEGRFVSLIDSDGQVLGRSDRIDSEALARAMLRLLALQARGAKVELQKFGAAEPDSSVC